MRANPVSIRERMNAYIPEGRRPPEKDRSREWIDVNGVTDNKTSDKIRKKPG